MHPPSISPSARGIRTTLIGVFANALLAGIKAIAGIVGNSYALVADVLIHIEPDTPLDQQ